MSQYLLSTFVVEGAVPGAPMSQEDMQAFMKRVADLEAEMDANGTFVFGGALHGPDASTVVNLSGDDVMLTDGPFAEAKELIRSADSACCRGSIGVFARDWRRCHCFQKKCEQLPLGTFTEKLPWRNVQATMRGL